MRGSQYHKVYRFHEADGSWEEVNANTQTDVDVFDVQEGLSLVGHHSYYFLNDQTDRSTIVYRGVVTKEGLFAIAADPTHPRTIATHVGDEWTFHYPDGYTPPRPPYEPQELWIPEVEGKGSVQGFYYGPKGANEVVLWLHGGPHENVSPRYNAYFHALNEFGIGVLALNYPGSTGRGREYEKSFRFGKLKRSLDGVMAYFEREKVKRIYAWSVSSGVMVLDQLLYHGYPIVAFVDQSGARYHERVAYSRKKKLPLFVIRGLYDRFPVDDEVNFVYAGGHDIESDEQLRSLFERVIPFLRKSVQSAKRLEEKTL